MSGSVKPNAVSTVPAIMIVLEQRMAKKVL